MLFILVLSEEELFGLPSSILVCIQYARPGSAAAPAGLHLTEQRRLVYSCSRPTSAQQ